VSRFVSFTVAISLVFLSLLFISCFGCGGNPASDEKGQDLSQIELPPKGNPKLDSQLNQLVCAESRGETASFAEHSAIYYRPPAPEAIFDYGNEVTSGITTGGRPPSQCLPGQ